MGFWTSVHPQHYTESKIQKPKTLKLHSFQTNPGFEKTEKRTQKNTKTDTKTENRTQKNTKTDTKNRKTNTKKQKNGHNILIVKNHTFQRKQKSGHKKTEIPDTKKQKSGHKKQKNGHKTQKRTQKNTKTSTKKPPKPQKHKKV